MAIRFKPGDLYLIRNYITREGTYFEVSEAIDHEGHQIAYGYRRPYEVRVPAGQHSGLIHMDGRPEATCRPNLEASGAKGLEALANLIWATGGDGGTKRPMGQLRISLLPPNTDPATHAVKLKQPGAVEEEPAIPISKIIAEYWKGTSYKEGWTGKVPNRDGLISSQIKVLTLYNDILRLGRLPEWFLNDRRAANNAAKKQANPLLGDPKAIPPEFQQYYNN